MKVGKLLETLTRYKLSDDVMVMVLGQECELTETKRAKSDNVRYLNQSKLVLIPNYKDTL